MPMDAAVLHPYLVLLFLGPGVQVGQDDEQRREALLPINHLHSTAYTSLKES